ncbi:hypothetical protein OG594_46250 [Streptomyces sp. NBC_01214]|uniref:hypothetical protein n=1 Tax=Streptomyces sp. NBC_01214 TaxID=2903777 RepID=UPI002259FACC|nr:hypothetical protein [Streptomyces sp. NBC_01214]MCX4808863.1 hypothetical protein [Streptomyces sp. NBC_01214]
MADMIGGGSWWVLVETSVGGDFRWELVRTIPVDGGRDGAVDRAAQLARTCSDSGFEAKEPEAYGRRVFRTAETGWLVEVGRSYWPNDMKSPSTLKTHVRITVGELEHESETPVAQPPAKGRLRRALGGS